MFKIRQKIKDYLNPRHPAAVILMYHRIRDARPDPWETSVSREHFRQQMEVVNRYFDVCSFSDWSDLNSGKMNKKRKLVITFDDGYLDNYEEAVPVLRTYGASATFFIPTQILNGKNHFWWEMIDFLFWDADISLEELTGIVRQNFLPDTSVSGIGLRRPELEDGWSANSMNPATERCRLYLELSAFVKEKSVDKQQQITNNLEKIYLGAANNYTDFRKMDRDQLIELAKTGFELGAHSVHHPALGAQDAETQYREITGSKMQLESVIQKNVSTFAYPHGHYNETTRSIIKEAAFSFACTTEDGVVYKDSDPLTLPRLWVKDWDGPTFEKILHQYFK